MEEFKKFQPYISDPLTAAGLQWTMILSVALFVTAASVHWFWTSTSLQLPVSFVLFYLVKMLSDTSLTVARPNNIMWQPLPILGLNITNDTFFHANVDVFCGLLILSSFYLMRIGNLMREC